MERQSSQSIPAIVLEEGESVAPPPPASSTSNGDRDSTETWLREQVTKSRRESRAALTVATTAIEGVKRIEVSIGQSPDPARGTPGSGMQGVMSAAVAEMTREREERAKRRAAWASFGKGVAVAVGAIGALVGVLSKIFHW